MNETKFPVLVAVQRSDGSVEHVRVGSAVRHGEGFVLQLGELTIGSAAIAESRSSGGGGGAPSGMVFPNYGRSKGAPIAGATNGDLEYYAAGARRSLADPSKSRFHEKERQLLAAIEAEMARQGNGDGPPPFRDEDFPQ